MPASIPKRSFLLLTERLEQVFKILFSAHQKWVICRSSNKKQLAEWIPIGSVFRQDLKFRNLSFFCHSKPIAASSSSSFAYLCFDLTSGAFAELRKFETGDFRVSSFGFKKHMNEQSARNKKNKNRTWKLIQSPSSSPCHFQIKISRTCTEVSRPGNKFVVQASLERPG